MVRYATVFKFRQVPFDLPVRTDEIMHDTPLPYGFGYTLATDGQSLIIDTKYYRETFAEYRIGKCAPFPPS